MNIGLELYKTFYYVAKNESITRAANELMISQPAISKSIKTLEEQLNTNLFVRKRDGVILTEAGEVIYKKIKSAMELINSAESDIDSLTKLEYGSINIGASKTILHEYLMPYITKFHDQFPNINIRVYTEKTSELLKNLQMGIIDIVFTNLPISLPQNLTGKKLLVLHDCFVANDNYSYLKNKNISLSELQNLPLLVLTKGTTTRIALDEYCIDNKININPIMEFGGNTLVKEFTEAGFGIGLLTKEYIKEEIENGKLFELELDKPLKEKYLGLVYNNESKKVVTSKFIDFIL